MAKKVRLPESSPDYVLDVFEAIKRALIRRGLFRQKAQDKRPSQQAKRLKELKNIAHQSHEILFKANSVFPFSLFPDTVTLDREKLSFATRHFFKIAQVTSVPVRDILSVEADTGPFFGSVHTASRYFVTNPKTIKWLWREDAVKLQRLLQGYIIVHEQEIECSHIKKSELIKLLNDLGTGRTS